MNAGTHGFPPPVPDADSVPYWEAAAADRVFVQGCAACGRGVFPPLPGACPFCRGELAWREVSRAATVYSWIGVERAIHGWEASLVPFSVVLAQLVELPDVRIPSLFPGPAGELRLDLPGEVHFSSSYGPGVRPVFSTQSGG